MKILLVAIAAIIITSCSNPAPDDSSTTFQVSSQNKQSSGVAFDSVAIVKPTWGQAIYYADKSGTVIYKVLALLSLAAFCFAIFKLTQTDGPTQTFSYSGMLLLTLGLFVYGWWGKASTVKFNNTKEIPIVQYREKGAAFVWDSLYMNNRIIGAASK